MLWDHEKVCSAFLPTLPAVDPSCLFVLVLIERRAGVLLVLWDKAEHSGL